MIAYPWLQGIYDRLTQALSADRLHHAILLQGPEGMGKQVLAKTLAEGLLCTQAPDLHACGQCKACRLNQAGTHPDVLLIHDEEKSIGIDAIRKGSRFIYQTTQLGERRVLLMFEAEKMTEPAANALLKTLEEPCKNVYLVLCCNHPSRLLATIRSRCLKMDVSSVEGQAAFGYLQNLYPQLHDSQFSLLFKLANQAPLKVQKWLEDGKLDELDQLRQMFSDWLANRVTTLSWQQKLEDNEFAFLLFYALLVEYMQYHHQASAEHLARVQQLFTQLQRFGDDKLHVAGQNKALALLNLLNQIKRLLA